jgi:hypothetical protein
MAAHSPGLKDAPGFWADAFNFIKALGAYLEDGRKREQAWQNTGVYDSTKEISSGDKGWI